jgi:hypothetical protein
MTMVKVQVRVRTLLAICPMLTCDGRWNPLISLIASKGDTKSKPALSGHQDRHQTRSFKDTMDTKLKRLRTSK